MNVEGSEARIALVAIPPPDGVIDRLQAFMNACWRKAGLRLEGEGDRVAVFIEPSRIERLGPLVEAAAVVTGARLLVRLPVGEIEIPLSGDLDSRPSRLWAAIGNAVDEDAAAQERGDLVAHDPFRYVRVETVEGIATAVDARPPLVEPTGGPADDAGPTEYDDVDYHQGAVEAAGQPIENAFAHMGLFLAWSIRHDLHDRRTFPADHIKAIKARAWTGSDIADDVDGKLVSDMFTAEGAGFADARYGAYLEAYGETFADLPDYGVPDDASAAERIEPVIDGLYREWVEAGRPPPKAGSDDLAAGQDIPWDEISVGSVAISPDGSWDLIEPITPHNAPDIEALLPRDLTDTRLMVLSVSAREWRSSVLNRALRALGVRPGDATVAVGIGGSGKSTLTVTVYRIPGVSAERLREAFATVIVRPGRAKWQDRSVSGRDASWAEGAFEPGGMPIAVAYWTRDGHVFHAAGQIADVELAIRRVGIATSP